MSELELQLGHSVRTSFMGLHNSPFILQFGLVDHLGKVHSDNEDVTLTLCPEVMDFPPDSRINATE